MSPRSIARYLLPVGLTLVANLCFAGAWTPEKGKTYLKLSANLFTSYGNYDIEGDYIDPFAAFPDQYSRFTDENLTLYVEHGLRDRLAIYGSLVYKRIEQRTVTSAFDLAIDTEDFGDAELGVRYQLTDGPDVFAVALLAKLPYLYDEDLLFAIGNGQEDIEARGLYGRSLGRGFYTGLEIAYRHRLEEPSDEWRGLLELGWSGGRFYARGKLDTIQSVDAFEPVAFGVNPLLSPQYDLTKLELTGGWSINEVWHLEYSYTDTLAGRNTASGHNTSLAIVWTF